MRKITTIFGVPIDMVTLETAVDRFDVLFKKPDVSLIFTPNTEIVMKAKEDSQLKEALLGADMNIPDGIGLILASKIHKLGLKERVTGIDLMDRILNYCDNSKKSIYILGGKPGVAAKACANIKKKFTSIVIKGHCHGYFTEKDEIGIIDEINKLKPDILFVALGAPRQEKWIYKNRKLLDVKVAMGVGGSVDVWAGTVKRAPVIYQKLGLEWFYRLLKEPLRYKRMMALPKFMLKVIFSKNIS